jgi:TonB family protein
MLFSPNLPKDKLPARLGLSLVSHAALLAVVVLLVLHTRVRPVYHESRCCTVALYWTGNTTNEGKANAPPAVRRQKTRRAVTPASAASKNPAPVPAAQSTATQPGVAAPQQPTEGTGDGSENAEPAFPVFYPTPGVPDPSLLPATERKVIVDVQISAVGEVIDAKLVQGLGNNVDQIVLNTVKGWRFHPATLNGTAIASVEELVFPFSRNAPSIGTATGA